MALNTQIKQVKFDFFDTSTVASIANTVLDIQNMEIMKVMESGKAPFMVEALSGNILNNILGFRMKVKILFEHTNAPSSILTLLNNWYTYHSSTVVQIRLYPNWSNDTTNYIVSALENPAQDLTNFENTIGMTNQPSFEIIEKSRRTSIPTFLEGF